MSMTDQCVHGGLVGACVYCAMGSKSLADRESIISKLTMMNAVNHQMGEIEKFQMYMAQRDIFLASMHQITNYVQKNNLKIGDQDCDDCNELLTILGVAMNKCIALEKERKSKN